MGLFLQYRRDNQNRRRVLWSGKDLLTLDLLLAGHHHLLWIDPFPRQKLRAAPVPREEPRPATPADPAISRKTGPKVAETWG